LTTYFISKAASSFAAKKSCLECSIIQSGQSPFRQPGSRQKYLTISLGWCLQWSYNGRIYV